MSIIEKAANRLGQPRPADAAEATIPAAPAAAPVAEAVHAAPAAAAPAPAPAVPAAAAAPVAPVAQPHGDASRRSTHTVELDLMRMHESGLVTAAGGRTALVEDFRIIKRPLIKRAFGARKPGDNPGNLIMITSSLPGEGKTFCAINLAMSIAMELDHTVLLVDADVARPSVLRTLGLPAQRGLMDILLDDSVDMADVMLRTNVNTLSILPAGTSSPRATELPSNCAAEVPCLVDASGIQPTFIGDLPPQLTALIRTNINVQELTVQALMTENREHIYHAAMMDPHTAAELDLDQIWSLVDELLATHGTWLPEWARSDRKVQAA